MILIGSRSLKLRLGDYFKRPCIDFDFVCSMAEFEEWKKTGLEKVDSTKVYPIQDGKKWIVEGKTNCEFELTGYNTSADLLNNIVKNDPTTMETPFGLVPSLNILFAIKDAHRFKKFNDRMDGWWKTASDWHLMKNMGAEIEEGHKEFHRVRQEEAYAGQNHPKLNVKAGDFFKDEGQLTYQYNHDDIHIAVAPSGVPAYTRYLKDNSEVLCSREKFFAVDEEVRLAGVCEEAATLALERSLIPFPNNWTPDFAWRFALAKTLSSITSGFFRAYGYDYLPDVMKMYKKDYTGFYDRFTNALNAGNIRAFSGSKY